jgi:hypothetical protein
MFYTCSMLVQSVKLPVTLFLVSKGGAACRMVANLWDISKKPKDHTIENLRCTGVRATTEIDPFRHNHMCDGTQYNEIRSNLSAAVRMYHAITS